MYRCYEKYSMQQLVEIKLSSRVIRRVLVLGSRTRTRTAHIALNIKIAIFLSCCIMYYFNIQFIIFIQNQLTPFL